MKRSALNCVFSSLLLASLLSGLTAARGADALLVNIAGHATTGPGGWDLTVDARLASGGATGYIALLGGATGPVIQIVPISACDCWCLNARRVDVMPPGPDYRENVYVRDIGDGISTFDQFSLVSGIGIDCSFPIQGLFFLTFIQGNFAVTIVDPDTDADGVPDTKDACPFTTADLVVNEHGCSIDQLVPCAGPLTGGGWRNHADYTAAFRTAADAFLAAGLFTKAERRALARAAAFSDCGKK